MSDFQYIQKTFSKKWSILVPHRSDRPKAEKGSNPICPFCIGQENNELELERISDGGEWLIRVIANKFPFADPHELIIHSPDHHKNIDELPESQVLHIFQTFQHRYKVNQGKGTVVMFHNRGEKAGESLPHPHTQLVVLPHEITLETPQLRDLVSRHEGNDDELSPILSDFFMTFCPKASEWPDEVVIAPRRPKTRFSDATGDELSELAGIMQKVLRALTVRLGAEFSFNFYIYPLFDWYIRITPRVKVIGGFEITTHIPVVTKDPAETMQFLRERIG